MKANPVHQAFDLYNALSADDKHAFLRQVAAVFGADAVAVMAKGLTPAELERYWMVFFAEVFHRWIPLFQREAIRLAREQPGLSEEDFQKEFDDRITKTMQDSVDKLVVVDRAKVKAKRDRGSGRDTIKRNAEMCRLFDAGNITKYRLGKKFHLTKEYVKRVLDDKDKWYRLAAALADAEQGTN